MNQTIGQPTVTALRNRGRAAPGAAPPRTILFLKKPTVVKRDGRYALYDIGIICDCYSALEWFAAPDEDISWTEAAAWVRKLSVAGGGWRLPDLEQLQGLYKKNKAMDLLSPLFKLHPGDMWSSETSDGAQALGFNFVPGNQFRTFKTVSTRFRAMAVRPRQHYGAAAGLASIDPAHVTGQRKAISNPEALHSPF